MKGTDCRRRGVIAGGHWTGAKAGGGKQKQVEGSASSGRGQLQVEWIDWKWNGALTGEGERSEVDGDDRR